MKKILIIFIAVITAIFVSRHFVKAQTIALDGLSVMCLNSSVPSEELNLAPGWCGGCPHDVEDPSTFDDTICVIDTGQATGSGNPIHQCPLSHPPSDGIAHFTLTNHQENRLPAGAIVYPAIPVDVNGEIVYTTTIPENDYTLYCQNGNNQDCYNEIDSLFGRYTGRLSYPENPTGIFNADSQGNISITGVITGVSPESEYPFYALYQGMVLGGGGTTTDQITGAANSQQQGTTQFIKPIFEDTNTTDKCINISWDPYGRVFDSQSLEPIPSIKVSLLSSINPDNFVTVISGNPVTTKADGVFNFLINPGTYYLKVNNFPNTHTFSANPVLNNKYGQIYRLGINGESSIYKPDSPINEIIDTPEEAAKGKPDMEERDIALDPGKNKPYTAPITHMELTQLLEGDYIVFRGKASHPYPLLTIKDEYGNILLNKKEFTNEKARYGFWTISLKASSLPTNTTLIPILTKNPKYFATDSTVNIIDKNSPQFEPILRSIEGYAYDDEGKVIPNTKVSVKLYMTRTEYASTLTDSSGYFTFSSLKLPPFSYYLEYNNKIKTTSNFVKDNQSYLKSNNINLMSLNTSQSISETGNSNSANNFFGNASNKFQDANNPVLKNNQLAKTAQVSFFKKELILAVVILSFLLVAVLMLVFYIKKHKIL